MRKRKCVTCGDKFVGKGFYCKNCGEIIDSIIQVMFDNNIFKNLKQTTSDYVINIDIVLKNEFLVKNDNFYV